MQFSTLMIGSLDADDFLSEEEDRELEPDFGYLMITTVV